MHCSLRPSRPGSSTHQLDLLLASQFLKAALLAIGLKAATCQKGTIQVSAVTVNETW